MFHCESTGPLAHDEVSLALLRKLEDSKPDFTVIFTEDKNGFLHQPQKIRKFSLQDDPLVRVQIGGM